MLPPRDKRIFLLLVAHRVEWHDRKARAARRGRPATDDGDDNADPRSAEFSCNHDGMPDVMLKKKLVQEGIVVTESSNMLERILVNMKDHRLIKQRMHSGQMCFFIEASLDVCRRLLQVENAVSAASARSAPVPRS